MLKSTLYILAFGTIFASCVPHQKYLETANRQEACEAENKQMKARMADLETQVNEFDTKYEVSQRRLKALQSDTAVLGTSLRILRSQYDRINELNDQILNKSASLNEGTEAEKRTLMVELEAVRVSLQNKEDSLNELEEALNAKEEELKDREEKLNELRSLINRKDSVMIALRKSVADALVGFEGNGLTIEQKNGRVYVSMEAKLLFATGSTEVDKKGKQAIINLARAIEGRDDLQVMVEGHTDADEFNKTTYPRNNWDLSVLRATSVVSIMIDNSEISPTILTAAGRSQFLPMDQSDKAKNRRIEVILAPNLDELMGIINKE